MNFYVLIHTLYIDNPPTESIRVDLSVSTPIYGTTSFYLQPVQNVVRLDSPTKDFAIATGLQKLET